jgi:hypothetical protein
MVEMRKPLVIRGGACLGSPRLQLIAGAFLNQLSRSSTLPRVCRRIHSQQGLGSCHQAGYSQFPGDVGTLHVTVVEDGLDMG